MRLSGLAVFKSDRSIVHGIENLHEVLCRLMEIPVAPKGQKLKPHGKIHPKAVIVRNAALNRMRSGLIDEYQIVSLGVFLKRVPESLPEVFLIVRVQKHIQILLSPLNQRAYVLFLLQKEILLQQNIRFSL